MKKTKGGPYLDYIWISKFRGIENQGFQFSRKFTYNYDDQKNTLTRLENGVSKKFIERFFDDNIEVNAIVGKNGCGKTSLMQAIYSFLGNGSLEPTDRAILVFRDGKVYPFCTQKKSDSIVQNEISYQEFRKGCTELELKWNNNMHSIPNLRCIYHSSVMDYQAINFSSYDNNDNTNASMSSLLTNYLERSFFSINGGYTGYVGKARELLKGFFFDEFEKQISLFSKMSEHIDDDFFMNLPQYATVSLKSDDTLINDLQWRFNLSKEDLNTLFKPLKKRKCEKGSLFKQFKLKFSLCLIAWLLYNTCYCIGMDNEYRLKNDSYNSPFNNNQRFNLTLKLLNYFLNHINSANNNVRMRLDNSWDIVFSMLQSMSVDPEYTLNNQIKLSHRDDIHLWFFKTYPGRKKYPTYKPDREKWYQEHEKKLGKKLDIEIEKDLEILTKNAHLLLDLACYLSEIEDEEEDLLITKPEFKIYLFENKPKDSLNFDLKKLWDKYRPFCMVYDFMNISWNLSSGEYARWAFLARIYNHAEKYQLGKKHNYHRLILLFDEADMLLHPEWQRNYVEQVVFFTKIMFPNIYVQIIIATHSPIMLSDIPNQNILFLQRKREACTDCYINGNETFAANIFSLYQDSFFIEDTGIGSFAKRKLTDLVSDIHKSQDKRKYSNDELMLWIETVGDVYLRAKLKNEFFLYRSEDKTDSKNDLTHQLREELRKKDNDLKKKDIELESMKKELEILRKQNNCADSEVVFDDKD